MVSQRTAKQMKGLTVCAMIGLVVCCGCASDRATSRRDAVDAKVKKLLSQMTLEEKVGQMTQLTLEPFVKDDKNGQVTLDEQKLRQGIVEYHIGSILNCGGQARSVENWQTVITQMQDVATKETRLGIPLIYGIDAVHGANYTLGATLFPQCIAMAASGNVELMKTIGEITAYEVRASGIPWNFHPVLDLGREPLWPRFFETFGEDPHVAEVFGTAYVEGLQGGNLRSPVKAAACLKHYLGYSVPHSGQDRTPAYIPERQLRQYFLKPFAAAVKAGAATVMVNSSEINGIPVHSDKYLLTDVLRGELGFRGFVVSDWADIENLYTRERVAKDRAEAVKMAVLAGVDMSMVPSDYSFYTTLVELVNNKEVPMKRIDEAVGRILRVKYRLGLFDKPYPDKELISGFAGEAAQKVNLQAAREAVTLLKNDKKTLPLSPDRKVLVTGPCANKLAVMNGGWTITWQGDREDLYPQDRPTILKAIQGKLGSDNVRFVEGVSFDKETEIEKAVSAASGMDAIIACIGEPPYCETPGNIRDLTLSEPQLKLVGALARTGKPIVLVLVEGRPRIIRSIVDHAGAIVMAYLPGMEGGQAVADILFGDANPSGKLPFTYPKWPHGHVPYDHKKSDETPPNTFDPQWPFGHGLSYTTFAYSRLRLDKNDLNVTDSLAVTIRVTNTGDRPGKEIVQLFLSDLVASVTPPVRSLKRFAKVELQPGQSEMVKFVLHPDDFSFIGRDNKLVVEPGEFKIMVSDLSESFRIQASRR